MANDATKYAVLSALTLATVKIVAEKAKIGADPTKGIPADVFVDFSKPVHAITSGAEASAYFDAVGADVFNSLLDYASDLKLRGAATTKRRAELTADPIADESKALVKGGMLTEAQAAKYIELRKGGTAKVQSLIAATAE